MNLFDLVKSEELQVRDVEGNVLWQGKPQHGHLRGTVDRDEVLGSITTLDGEPIYSFGRYRIPAGSSFDIPGDLIFSTP